MKRRPELALALVLALPPAHALVAAQPASRTGSDERTDPAREAVALLQTDVRFAEEAKTRGIGEAFARYAAAEAMLMPAGGDPVTGADSIRRHFADLPAGATLAWKPFHAEVSRSGDLGYTLGKYEYRAPGPDGKTGVHYGKYCSVWKRQSDGAWKWVIDIGNPSPEPRP